MSTGPVAATKRPQDENFPVASLALSRVHRDAVLAFYRFVRMADDIADAPNLAPDEKLARLAALENALIAGDATIPEAARLHAADARHGTGIAEARDMLRAFRQDVGTFRYETWDDLIGYCRVSANPAGRFLLRLHGESADAEPFADALCTALQILNHLQDCRRDRENLDRIYLPSLGSLRREAMPRSSVPDPSSGGARSSMRPSTGSTI